jgi:hypothetical protein
MTGIHTFISPFPQRADLFGQLRIACKFGDTAVPQLLYLETKPQVFFPLEVPGDRSSLLGWK